MNRNKNTKTNTRVIQSQLKVTSQSSCPAEILSSIPNFYESLKFSHLVAGRSYKNKCIVGKIEFLTELKSNQKNYNLRKCLLSDALENEGKITKEKLSVFLFDGFAVDSNAAEIGGFLAISNFQVENLTLACRSVNGIPVLPVQVIVKDTDGSSETSIWITKKVPRQPGREGLRSQTAKERKRRPASDYIASSSSATETTPKKKSKSTERIESSTSSALTSSRRMQTSETSASAVASPRHADKIYTYTPLGELTESRSPKEVFNVFGVVEDCFLKLNQGTHTSTLDLVLSDPTKSEFPVIVFSGKGETFPDVHPGDVVRLHRMMVDCIRGKLKGRCCLSTFLLVFSHSDNGSVPKSVAKSFTLSNEDKHTAVQLFEWAEKKQWKLISDVDIGEFANILCQVVSVYFPRTSDSVLLTIWDGTKTDKIKFEYQGRPTEIIDQDIFKTAKHYAVHLWVNGNYSVAAADLKPGQFIKILNAQLYCRKGAAPDQSNFCIHPQFKENRGIIVVNDDDDCLLDLRSRLKKRTEEFSLDITEDMQLAEANDFFTNCDISTLARESEFPKEAPSDDATLAPESASGKEVSPDIVPSTQSGLKRRKLFVEEEEEINVDTNIASQQAADNKVQNVEIAKAADNKRMPAASSKPASEQSCVKEPSAIKEAHTTQLLNKNMSTLDEILREITSATSVKGTSAPPGPSLVKESASSSTVRPSQETQLKTGLKKSNIVDGTPVKQVTEAKPSCDIQSANENRNIATHESLVQHEVGNEILSVLNAGLKPGQHTQEMGGHNSGNSVPSSQLEALSQFPFSMFGSFPNTQDELSSSIPTVSVTDGHSNIKHSTLNQVVAHSVPYKFRILAAVLDFQPETDSITKMIRLYCSECDYLSIDSAPEVRTEESEDGTTLYCPDPDCNGKSSKLEYTYLLSFLLHDGSPSQTIDVFLWRNNAVKFFKGIPPEKALSDSAAADSIFKMLWDICPNSRPMGTLGTVVTDNLVPYPVLDCCIMSYTAGGVTRYQMFDTILL